MWYTAQAAINCRLSRVITGGVGNHLRESAPVEQTGPTIAWGLFSYEQRRRLFVFNLDDVGP